MTFKIIVHKAKGYYIMSVDNKNSSTFFVECVASLNAKSKIHVGGGCIGHSYNLPLGDEARAQDIAREIVSNAIEGVVETGITRKSTNVENIAFYSKSMRNVSEEFSDADYSYLANCFEIFANEIDASVDNIGKTSLEMDRRSLGDFRVPNMILSSSIMPLRISFGKNKDAQKFVAFNFLVSEFDKIIGYDDTKMQPQLDNISQNL